MVRQYTMMFKRKVQYDVCNLENKSHRHAPKMLLMKGISSV